MAKNIAPPRNQPLVNADRTPTKRTANFMEELSRQSASISDVTLTAPSANEILLRDAVNDILAALRERGQLED